MPMDVIPPERSHDLAARSRELKDYPCNLLQILVFFRRVKLIVEPHGLQASGPRVEIVAWETLGPGALNALSVPTRQDPNAKALTPVSKTPSRSVISRGI